MKAALITQFDSSVAVQDVPDPQCSRDGAIVAVRACGVCRSDHHAWKGADPDVVLPHVMGHEFAGEVVEVGPECRGFRVGDRVTAPFILGCGHCPDCRSGEATICNDQQVIGFSFWGAFAEYVAIPHADFNLVSLPDSMGYDVAAGMGCRVTTAWRGLVDRAAVKPGEWVAVHGCGGVGLSVIMIAKALGARVIGIDVSEDALGKAQAVGANAVLNAAQVDDVGEAVREVTTGGAHVSLDALGVTVTYENSLRSLRKLGRHIQIGMPVGPHAEVSLPLLDLVYARQLSLHGMRGLSAAGFAPLMDMISGGRLDLSALVTRRIKLSEAETALRAMDTGQPAGVTVITELNR